MREQFERLIGQIDEIEAKFHYSPPSSGLIISHEEEIHDVPAFQLWIQNIQLELQEIMDQTGDKFVEGTLEAAKERFDGWQDKTKFTALKAKLLAMHSNLNKYYAQDKMDNRQGGRRPKIFISHSTKDKSYVAQIVALLDDMGLDQTQVFCSSLPGYDIPVDMNIFDYLREQFLSFDLHVLFIHSRNYYQSAVSLNEMGAAWALKSGYTSILLPGFTFAEMTGVVNGDTIAIKLDNDTIEVKDKLNQLYTYIVEEFSLTKKADIIWEQKRDQFIKEVVEIKIPEVPIEEPSSHQEDDLELLENGLYILKSERATGKNLFYCSACYQNHKKLFPVVKGSLARDRFCSNCRMNYKLG